MKPRGLIVVLALCAALSAHADQTKAKAAYMKAESDPRVTKPRGKNNPATIAAGKIRYKWVNNGKDFRVILPNTNGVKYQVNLGMGKDGDPGYERYVLGDGKPGKSPTLRYVTYQGLSKTDAGKFYVFVDVIGGRVQDRTGGPVPLKTKVNVETARVITYEINNTPRQKARDSSETKGN